jgi:hypothetical protein
MITACPLVDPLVLNNVNLVTSLHTVSGLLSKVYKTNYTMEFTKLININQYCITLNGFATGAQSGLPSADSGFRCP